MPTFFNFNKRKGVFMIPAGATKSPTPAPPPAFNNTKSLSYDGVDESVHLGTNLTDLKFTGAFTLSCWVKFNSLTGIQGILEATSEGAVFGADGYLIWKSSGNTIQFYIRQGGSWKIATSTTTVTTGAWYHIGATWDGVSTSKIYINGIEEGSNTTITSITYPTTTSHNIGGYQSRSGSPYIIDGLIDEVSFYNTALSDADISTIATAPSDLSTYNPIAWYRMGDNSTYQTPQILMPENTNKDKVSNYSLSMDGVDDYINVGLVDFPSALLDDFSVSYWVKMEPMTGSNYIRRHPVSVSTSVTALDQTVHLRVWGFNTQYKVRIIGSLSGGGEGTTDISDNQWHHIAYTYEYDASTTYYTVNIYVDGNTTPEVTAVMRTTVGYATKGLHTIGVLSDYVAPYNLVSGTYFLGEIDEISIYSSALNSTQISELYNSGTPTTITGATAYWKLGEQSKFTDNWLVPNSALSNYSKFSFNFDGVDDYISANKLNLTTAISVSCWVKTTTTGLLQAIVNEDRASGTNRNWLLYVTSSNKVCFLVWHTDGTNTQLIRSTALEVQDGNWHHILVTWDGTTNANQFKSFVDGSNEESKTATSTGIRNLSPYGIAIASLQQNAGYRYSGNIDEVAVWNSDQSANVSTIYNGGTPTTISGAVAHWRMGEEATYNASTSQWTIPDQVGSNDGTSSNTMALDTLVGEAPNYFGGGVSDAMTIEDRVGDAPNSSNNAVSYNMEAEDIDNNTP
jgi:hypothetical protein